MKSSHSYVFLESLNYKKKDETKPSFEMLNSTGDIESLGYVLDKRKYVEQQYTMNILSAKTVPSSSKKLSSNVNAETLPAGSKRTRSTEEALSFEEKLKLSRTASLVSNIER